jgi:xanthine/CO dehydrogenase XdhC/CoxF family maturation factor
MGVAGSGKNGAPRADFVHLHVHSEYSLLDGAAQLEKIERVEGQGKKEKDVGLIARAAELGFPALALTDHGNLFGAIDFYAACKQSGIKPIIGSELYVAPGSRFERSGQDGGYEGASHATVLVRNETGYRNLIKLVSKAYLEGFYYKPRVDHELLAQHADGLLVLSGCLNSEVSRQLSAGDEAKARETAGWYQEVFGKDFYFMEIQSHGIEEQSRVTEGTVRLARELGYETVVVDGRAAFATPERFPDVDRLVVGWPDEVADEIELGPNDAVAVLSHDVKFDEPAIVEALRRGCRYVGAVGSRKTQADRRARLLEAGVDPADLARLHGPIGLDLGGRAPAETALAILAEIVAERYGGTGRPMLEQATRAAPAALATA